MKFIIDEKIYDTDKSELIIEYVKPWPVSNLFWKMTINKKTELYKTQKGNWFSVSKGDYDKFLVEKETDDYVKDIFRHNAAVELYNKYFNQLEEA